MQCDPFMYDSIKFKHSFSSVFVLLKSIENLFTGRTAKLQN